MDTINNFFSDDDEIKKQKENIDKMVKTKYKFIITIILLSCALHNPFMYTIMGYLISRIPFPPFNLVTIPSVSNRSLVLFIIHSIVLGAITYALLYFSDEKSDWISPCNVHHNKEEGGK